MSEMDEIDGHRHRLEQARTYMYKQLPDDYAGNLVEVQSRIDAAIDALDAAASAAHSFGHTHLEMALLRQMDEVRKLKEMAAEKPWANLDQPLD